MTPKMVNALGVNTPLKVRKPWEFVFLAFAVGGAASLPVVFAPGPLEFDFSNVFGHLYVIGGILLV